MDNITATILPDTQRQHHDHRKNNDNDDDGDDVNPDEHHNNNNDNYNTSSRHSYSWPNIFEEGYDMILVCVMLYGVVDLRQLARKNMSIRRSIIRRRVIVQPSVVSSSLLSSSSFMTGRNDKYDGEDEEKEEEEAIDNKHCNSDTTTNTPSTVPSRPQTTTMSDVLLTLPVHVTDIMRLLSKNRRFIENEIGIESTELYLDAFDAIREEEEEEGNFDNADDQYNNDNDDGENDNDHRNNHDTNIVDNFIDEDNDDTTGLEMGLRRISHKDNNGDGNSHGDEDDIKPSSPAARYATIINADDLEFVRIGDDIYYDDTYDSNNNNVSSSDCHGTSNKNGDLVYGITIQPSKRRITVVFRGCSSTKDWTISAETFMIEITNPVSGDSDTGNDADTDLTDADDLTQQQRQHNENDNENKDDANNTKNKNGDCSHSYYRPETIAIHRGFYRYLFEEGREEDEREGDSNSDNNNIHTSVDDDNNDNSNIHNSSSSTRIKLNKFQSIVNEVEEFRERYPGYNVYVTGHSLGGSLATIFAFHYAALSSTQKEKETTTETAENGNIGEGRDVEGGNTGVGVVTCIPIASPMVGNLSFELAFKLLEKRGQIRCMRVTNHFDVFTQLPDHWSFVIYMFAYHFWCSLLWYCTGSWLFFLCCQQNVYRHVGMDLHLYSSALFHSNDKRRKCSTPRQRGRSISNKVQVMEEEGEEEQNWWWCRINTNNSIFDNSGGYYSSLLKIKKPKGYKIKHTKGTVTAVIAFNLSLLTFILAIKAL